MEERLGSSEGGSAAFASNIISTHVYMYGGKDGSFEKKKKGGGEKNYKRTMRTHTHTHIIHIISAIPVQYNIEEGNRMIYEEEEYNTVLFSPNTRTHNNSPSTHCT